MRLSPLAGLTALGLTACTSGTDAHDHPTWHADVRPLVETHCASCHTAGGVAPFTFDDPQAAASMGQMIVAAVESGSMPPWHFEDDCREIEGDTSLDDATKAVFSGWAEGDFALGDASTYVAPDLPERVPVPPPSHEASPLIPFAPDTSQIDQYLCQASDLVFDEETFISFSEVVPDRLDMVHHVIAYAVPEEQFARLGEMSDGDPMSPFSCWGSPVAEIGIQVGGWVPGTEVDIYPTTMATRVPAGARVILEMHYNTLAADLTGDDQDNTGIRFWTLPKEEVDTLLLFWSLFDVFLDIPAGESSWDEGALSKMPLKGTLIGSSPHMHQLGSHAKTVHTRDGVDTCITDVAWDFSWQRVYSFAEPVEVNVGDTFDLTCTFDNTPANQLVVDGEALEPVDVSWGDGSLDEMCIDSLLIAVPFEPDSPPGICGGYDSCYQDCDEGDGACAVACYAQAGGETCYACGLEALFGPCTSTVCSTEAFRAYSCMETCGDAVYNDFYGCIVDTCAESFETYFACAQPLFEEGTCAADYAMCQGIVP